MEHFDMKPIENLMNKSIEKLTELKQKIMVELQFFNEEDKQWQTVSEWHCAATAWQSLGRDEETYRVIDKEGNILIKSAKNNE